MVMHKATYRFRWAHTQLSISALVVPLVLSVALASSAAAQSASPGAHVTPGDPRLEVDGLTSTVDTFHLMTEAQGARRPAATLVRTVTRGIENGREILKVVQRSKSPEGSSVDTSVVDAETLAPLSYVSHRDHHMERFAWEGGVLQGFVRERGDSVHSTTQVEGRFNAVVDDLVIRALKLEPGDSVRYRAVNPGRALLDVRLKMVGWETLQRSGRTAEVRRLEYDTGIAHSTLWLDRRSGALLLQETALPSGGSFWKGKRGWLPAN